MVLGVSTTINVIEMFTRITSENLHGYFGNLFDVSCPVFPLTSWSYSDRHCLNRITVLVFCCTKFVQVVTPLQGALVT